MAAAEVLTWDRAAADGGAYRATITDLGDATLENDPGEPPPTDGTELYDDMCNQWAKQIAAVNRTMDGVKFTIAFDGGGAPFIDRVQAAGTLIDASTFTLTDNGNGDTTVAWDAGDFPALTCDPRAWMGEDGSWLHPTAVIVTATSIRVRTRVLAGTLTNGRVNVAF